MTEHEWELAEELAKMIVFAEQVADTRQARLFATSCCYQVWDSLRDSDCQTAIELAERFADGNVAESKLEPVRATLSQKLKAIEAEYTTSQVVSFQRMGAVEA